MAKHLEHEVETRTQEIDLAESERMNGPSLPETVKALETLIKALRERQPFGAEIIDNLEESLAMVKAGTIPAKQLKRIVSLLSNGEQFLSHNLAATEAFIRLKHWSRLINVEPG